MTQHADTVPTEPTSSEIVEEVYLDTDKAREDFENFADDLEKTQLTIGEDGWATDGVIDFIREFAEDNTIELPANVNITDLLKSLASGEIEIQGWTQEMSQTLANAFPDTFDIPDADTTEQQNEFNELTDAAGDAATAVETAGGSTASFFCFGFIVSRPCAE